MHPKIEGCKVQMSQYDQERFKIIIENKYRKTKKEFVNTRAHAQFLLAQTGLFEG